MNTRAVEAPSPLFPSYSRTAHCAYSKERGLLRSLAASHVLFLILLLVVGRFFYSPIPNLIGTCISALAAVILLDRLFLRHAFGRNTTTVALVAFIAKVVLGIAHYIWLINPNYTSQYQHVNYIWDYEWLNHAMILARNHWIANGLLAPMPARFYAEKNLLLREYFAILYYLGGVNVLSIAPWNALHSIYTAAIVGALGLSAGLNRPLALRAFFIAAFQPFGFISSVFWRDTVGQTSLSLAIYLLVTTQSSTLLSIAALPLSCTLAYAQREAYAFAAFVPSMLINLRYTARSLARFAVVLFIIFLFIYGTATGAFRQRLANASSHAQQNARTAESHLASVRFLPMRLVKAVVGPFPWYQIFSSEYPEYLPEDFAQQVLNVTVYILIFYPLFTKRKQCIPFAPTIAFGLILFLAGALAGGIHSSYVSTGTIFFLPLAVTRSKRAWRLTLSAVALAFLVANVLYASLGLTGSGISGIQEGMVLAPTMPRDTPLRVPRGNIAPVNGSTLVGVMLSTTMNWEPTPTPGCMSYPHTENNRFEFHQQFPRPHLFSMLVQSCDQVGVGLGTKPSIVAELRSSGICFPCVIVHFPSKQRLG